MATKVHLETKLHICFSDRNAICEQQQRLMINPWPQKKLPKEKQVCNTIEIYNNIQKELMERHEGQQSREIIRQTMLRQEEVFQQQVKELHRLYYVQKALMTELKNKSWDTSPHSSAKSETGPTFQFGSNSIQKQEKGSFLNTLSSSKLDRELIYNKPQAWEADTPSAVACNFFGKSIQGSLQESKGQTPDLCRMQHIEGSRQTPLNLEKSKEEYVHRAFRREVGLGASVAINVAPKVDRRDLCTEADIELTLGGTWSRRKTEQTNPQSISSSGSSFANSRRDAITPGFRVNAIRPESFCQDKLGQCERNDENKGNESFRLEWQSFDVNYDKSRRTQSLDLQTGENSTSESLRKPPWLIQAMNLNNT